MSQGEFDRGAKAAIFILATGAVIGGLYFFRGPLTQFALAMILFLGLSGFTRWLNRRTPLPRWASLVCAFVVVIGLVAAVLLVTVQNANQFINRSGEYENQLNALVQTIYQSLGVPVTPPSVRELIDQYSFDQFLGEAARGLQNFVADAIFIGIYLAFIFAAARTFNAKIEQIFPEREERRNAIEILSEIRRSMEKYLWVQTLISLMISALTLVSLLLIGLENAVFWAFLIFFLNYIPTVGSIIAVIPPTLAALVQFGQTDPIMIGITALVVGFWQFFIGNFVQPRMMGDSLNLSALVVLLSLAIWGLVWGIAGAFLSAPLTVMIMIILAQFSSTRWIAILLSSDGKPKIANRASRNRAARDAEQPAPSTRAAE